MGAKCIALLGAESTGKTRLGHELTNALLAQDLRATAVPEVLREWCTRQGRAPRPEEQLAIARDQEDRVDAATANADIVIADTSALMVAIYAGMLFPDGALYRFAIERQQRYDATLVTGLDLPWMPDGLQRDATASREDVDALVRKLLQQAGIPFQVVYGQGPQRLRGALRALEAAGVLAADGAGRTLEEGARGPWVWACEKCSDPECEHRLFTRLPGGRG
jgi:nicotinamide riboside kinase